MLIILFRSIAIVPGVILTSTGLQKIRAKTVIYSIVLSVILNFILIPKLGLEGAFISFLITNILIALMYVYYSAKKIKFISIPINFIIILIVYLFLQYSFSIDNKMFFLITIIINLLIQVLVQKKLKQKVNVTN